MTAIDSEAVFPSSNHGTRVVVVVALVLALAACSAMPVTSSRMAALIDANARYDAALVGADGAALAQLYADDFLYVTTPDDTRRDKSQQIAALTSGTVDLIEGKSSDVDARVHGDTATIIGKFSGRYVASGTTVSFVERYTTTWLWRDGAWRLVLEHGSMLSETP